MSLPTVNVTATFAEEDGDAVAGAIVTARLTKPEKYQGLVVPDRQTFRADDNGVVTLALWPNTLGSNGSQYIIKARSPSSGRRLLEVKITVPNEDSALAALVDLNAPATGQQSWAAVEQARAARDAAQDAQTEAEADATESKNWASYPEDQDVPEGGAGSRSALHQAAKAQQSATASSESATSSGNHRTTANRWATLLASTVVDAETGADSGEYSAQEHAVGTTVPGGSAKTWASSLTVVAGGLKGARGYAQDAAGSASAAATSESNAAASASAASSSETNAAGSATAASTSATNAAASETNAANSASAAATSETNAATSETNAATSETNAATSETNAATSETNAATSETNAANSASAASTSEANAAGSASAAATSETNAATSASNAATSESNAATSASSAATSEANTEALYDTFRATYYGAIDPSPDPDPTTDPNGDPPGEGDWYRNIATGQWRGYNGAVWETLPVFPVDDTTAIVRDPSDNTKQVRIDAGAVATGTTRVLSMPNYDVPLSNDGVLLRRNTNLAVPNNTVTVATFDEEIFDATGLADLGTDDTHIVVQESGLYFVFVTGDFAPPTASTGQSTVRIQRDRGGTITTESLFAINNLLGGASILTLTALLRLQAGDKVRAAFFHNMDGSRDVRGGAGFSWSILFGASRVAT